MHARILAVHQDPGVVEENVDAAIALQRLFHHGLHFCFLRNVCWDEESLASRIMNRLCRGVSAFGIDLRDHNLRTFRRVTQGDGLAKPHTCASDDRNLVFQPHTSSTCKGQGVTLLSMQSFYQDSLKSIMTGSWRN